MLTFDPLNVFLAVYYADNPSKAVQEEIEVVVVHVVSVVLSKEACQKGVFPSHRNLIHPKEGNVVLNQAYSRLSTTHGQITDCKLLVCMYWTRLVLVRPAASLNIYGRESIGKTK